MTKNKLGQFIKKKIQEIASSASEFSSESRKIAVEQGALLLYSDMGGGYCLDEMGRVFSVPWDDSTKVVYEDDRRIVNLVLFQGSRGFPELTSFLPSKTEFDEICPYCNGTGISKSAQEIGVDSIVCYCGGLGWIPSTPAD